MRLFTHLLSGPSVSTADNDVALVPSDVPVLKESAPTFVDVAERIGSEHETIRQLLKEIDFQFGAVGNLKVTFDKVVEPLHKLADALNHEVADNAVFRRALAELRAKHETLCVEYRNLEALFSDMQVDNKLLMQEVNSLKRANQSLEGDKAALIAQVTNLCTNLNTTESELQDKAEELRKLADVERLLLESVDASKKRAVELEVATAVERERASLFESERLSLQVSLDRALDRASKMSREIASLERLLAESNQRQEDLSSGSAQLQEECRKLSAACDEANQRRETGVEALTSQLDAARSRSAVAEKQCNELRQTSALQAEELKSVQAKLSNAENAKTEAEEKTASLRVAVDEQESVIKQLKEEHSEELERRESLYKTAESRDKSLKESREKIKLLGKRIEMITAEAIANQAKAERQLEQLKEEIERSRTERAVSEGALERARADLTRAQTELALLQQENRGDARNLQPEQSAADDQGT